MLAPIRVAIEAVQTAVEETGVGPIGFVLIMGPADDTDPMAYASNLTRQGAIEVLEGVLKELRESVAPMPTNAQGSTIQ